MSFVLIVFLVTELPISESKILFHIRRPDILGEQISVFLAYYTQILEYYSILPTPFSFHEIPVWKITQQHNTG
jgi:hypothetical protein